VQDLQPNPNPHRYRLRVRLWYHALTRVVVAALVTGLQIWANGSNYEAQQTNSTAITLVILSLWLSVLAYLFYVRPGKENGSAATATEDEEDPLALNLRVAIRDFPIRGLIWDFLNLTALVMVTGVRRVPSYRYSSSGCC